MSHKSHCIFELEFDGNGFGRIAMLAGDLTASLNHHVIRKYGSVMHR